MGIQEPESWTLRGWDSDLSCWGGEFASEALRLWSISEQSQTKVII
jgi:hypothetical protein